MTPPPLFVVPRLRNPVTQAHVGEFLLLMFHSPPHTLMGMRKRRTQCLWAQKNPHMGVPMVLRGVICKNFSTHPFRAADSGFSQQLWSIPTLS